MIYAEIDDMIYRDMGDDQNATSVVCEYDCSIAIETRQVIISYVFLINVIM